MNRFLLFTTGVFAVLCFLFVDKAIGLLALGAVLIGFNELWSEEALKEIDDEWARFNSHDSL